MPDSEAIAYNWLRWAIQVLGDRLEDYETFQDYYNGDHALEFATSKWESTFGTEFEEFADNWCQIVIDSLIQRLEILGWDGDNETQTKQAEELWARTYCGLVADDVHASAAIKGDSFVIVWEDPDNPGKSQIFFNDASEVQVQYDPQNLNKIIRAAKRWLDVDGSVHLYLYFPDRIEKWLAPSHMTSDQFAAMSSGLIPTDKEAAAMGFMREGPDVPNEFGEVPIFHFKNRGKGQTHGLSELKPVIPVQNAINKLWMDLIVGSEFGSFRQKWVASAAQPKGGFKVGGDRVWATSDSNAKFGEFGQIDLEPMFKAIEVGVAHVGKITQTPMHYLRTSGDMPSGEALKTAESGLVQKTKDRHKHWGSVWERVMRFALRIEGVDDPARIYPKWKSAETRHDLEQAQTAQLKSIMGIPLEQLWGEHFGYTEKQIEEFKGVNRALAASVLADVIAQTSQMPPGAEQVTATPDQLVQMLQNAPKIGNEGAGEGLDVTQILALLPKSVTGKTTAGEATTKPQPNSRPPASPTRRSRGFKD